MLIEAFGENKTYAEWLDDIRINPELTRDVLVKRIKRSSMSAEEALTRPVIKGAAVGDTPQRIQDRHIKAINRVKMFLTAQKVRSQYEKGVAVAEIMDRFGLTQSQVNKISQKNEWYNIHWSSTRGKYPEGFEELVKEVQNADSKNSV